jgi:hypothetical protein
MADLPPRVRAEVHREHRQRRARAVEPLTVEVVLVSSEGEGGLVRAIERILEWSESDAADTSVSATGRSSQPESGS